MGIPLFRTGTVVWKNGLRAADVEVRIFDQDPGGTDDDATLAAGRSGNEGHFTVSYDAARGVDLVNHEVSYWVWVGGLAGHLERQTRTVQVPDLTDAWTPYLLFRYQILGQPFSHWAWPTDAAPTYTLPMIGRGERQSFGAIDHDDVAGATTLVVPALPQRALRWSVSRDGDTWSPLIDLPGTYDGGKIALGRDAQRRLTLFARDGSGGLLYRRQSGVGGPWSDWHAIGGAFPSFGELMVARAGDGTLWVFVEGPSGSIWSTREAGDGYAPPQDQGGTIASGGSMCAATNQDGRLEVFAQRADGAIWHIYQLAPGGAWSGWDRLGGPFVAGPLAVAANADGRLELFAVGLDGSLLHSWQPAPNTGPWSSWGSLGGTVRGQLVAMRDGGGRVQVLAQTADRAIQVIHQDVGRWSGWRNLGRLTSFLDEVNGDGSASGPPFLIGLTADRRPLVVQGVFVSGEPPIWFRARDGGGDPWQDWHALGVAPSAGPPATPTNLAVTPLDGALRVTWSAAAGATGYVVTYGTTPGVAAFAAPPGAATTLDLLPLSNGLRYDVWVRATSSGGASPVAGPVAGTPNGARGGVFDLVMIDQGPDTTPFPPGPVFNRYFNLVATLRNNGTRATGPCSLQLVHVQTGGEQVEGRIDHPGIAPGATARIVFGVTVAHGAPLPASEVHTWLVRIGDWNLGDFTVAISNH